MANSRAPGSRPSEGAPVGRPPSSSDPGRVVAVTGSASFLGSNLVGLLEDAPRVQRVISLDVRAPGTLRDKTVHHDIDLTTHRAEDRLTDILRSEGADTLVHLAFHDVPSRHANQSHYLESVGTLHVLNACRRSQVQKFVLWSQTVLYGASPKNPCYLDEGRPLCARTSEAYFRDKMQAERDALEFGLPGRGRTTTIVRTAPIIGPGIDNYVTRYLTQAASPTILGFDPLWQFLHESDAVGAIKRAIFADVGGAYNIAGEGVLRLSTVLKLVGQRQLPLTRPMADAFVTGAWVFRRSAFPAPFLDYVQYACVADTERAGRHLGFVPLFSSREAVMDFASSKNLRAVRLIAETPGIPSTTPGA